ncbi:hypothetical protein N1851_006845 [Merluccius polli]|uniref:Uncharacterized protein n=1 Tax=Merluccius polli TaxID=89951 RepID=A0AA47N544_MERPO|nr:hypothetical protein N1851_006845 [Merluccius polli]
MLTLSSVFKQKAYVMLFDESLNHYIQSKQMDMHVRLWEGADVKTKYIGSEFMGHSTALDIVGKMSNLLSEIGVTNLIQISMDGPNVNWKVFDILQKSVQKDVGKLLVNIGSCGLHTLHNAFRDGCKSTGWEVEHALSSIYWLFHDCPARHEDFVTATGYSTNMLRFCKHRWIENVNVSERGMLLWPHVKAYVEMVGKGELPNPRVKSFEALKDRCADPLLIVKVEIFNSVAREVTPFQTDKPMLPFLSEDMFKLMKGLMGRFLKEKPLKEATSTLKLLHVAFQDSSLHKDASKIDIGFAAETTLNKLKSSKKISERQVLEIKMDCKKFLITMTDKLLKTGPVHHQLVRSMQCLDPRRMAVSKELCVPQMRKMLHTLVGAKHVEESVCDNILREFSEFCDSAALQANFREFDPKTDRVDNLLYETMGSKPSFSSVWDVVKVLLVLSHGQASVERGFSINKEMIVENQKEKSLVAQRLIVDHVRSVGGINKVEITKELLLSAAGARQKYHGYLDEEKRKKERQGIDMKRKALTDELDDLKKKRARMETDISALQKSADEYAEKAEATGKLTFITESNSFRRTAKEKKVSLLEIEKQIDAKLTEMRK